MPYQEMYLPVFQDLVSCCQALYLWTLDSSLHILQTSCPCGEQFYPLVVPYAHKEEICTHMLQYRKPVIVTNNLGLLWIADARLDKNELEKLHILGPFFMYDTSANKLEHELRQRKLTPALLDPAIEFFRALPIIGLPRVLEYGILLHYCITGEKLAPDDIRFPDEQPQVLSEAEIRGSHGTYEAEREMLRLVREGDLHYKKKIQSMFNQGQIGNISDGQELRQLKNMIIVNITLFSRAAMEGGLPPETAYTISDGYYQSVEKSRSMQAIIDINNAMQDDFVRRVHQYRQNAAYSKPVRICMEQLSSRMEEPITIESLAAELGYAPYYLSRKFRAETGRSFKDYLREIRLERACFLLANSAEPVIAISERLQFCSLSYFSDSFRKRYGCSPSTYRANAEKHA